MNLLLPAPNDKRVLVAGDWGGSRAGGISKRYMKKLNVA